MQAFQLIEGVVHCEGVPLPEIACAVGTPVFVYSSAAMRAQARALAAALASVGEPLIAFLFSSRAEQFLPVYPVLMVMIGIPLLAILSFPLVPMLYALDRADGPLKARIIATAIYFAIVAPLCWRFDTMGAAIALVAAHLVMVAILIVMVWREHRRVRAT